MKPFLLLLCLCSVAAAADRLPDYGRDHWHYSHAPAERDSRGHLKRNKTARLTFIRLTGYPKGRPGYIVDHIIPLKRNGPDCPCNMQWQTRAEAHLKDKTE